MNDPLGRLLLSQSVAIGLCARQLDSTACLIGVVSSIGGTVDRSRAQDDVVQALTVAAEDDGDAAQYLKEHGPQGDGVDRRVQDGGREIEAAAVMAAQLDAHDLHAPGCRAAA